MALDRPTDFFTEHHIDVSLNDVSKDATYEVKVSYKNSGTDLNSWKYVKQYKSKNKNVFRHTEPASLAHYRKKIIYCARSDAPLRPVEIAYFAALIKNRSVYLRLVDVDDPTKIRIEGPYRHLEDFLRDRRRAFASITEIIQSLANQHLSKDNFIFMDNVCYSGAFKKLSEITDLGKVSDQQRWMSNEDLSFLKNQSSEMLDLTWVPANEFERIAKSIDHSGINIIKLNAPNKQDIVKVCQLFLTVTTFEVPNATSEWVQNCLPAFRRHYHIILDNYGDIKPPPGCLENFNRCLGLSKENGFEFPVMQLNKLTIRNAKNHRLHFSAKKGADLFSLEMENCYNATGDLTELSTLQNLALLRCESFSVIFSKKNSIWLLKIEECQYLSRLEISQLPYLETFVFKNSGRHIDIVDSLLETTSNFSSCYFDSIYTHPYLKLIELNDPSSLDLTQLYSHKSKRLSTLAAPQVVKKIILRAWEFTTISEIRALKKRYPDLESLEVLYADQEWTNRLLSLLPANEVILNAYTSREFIFTKDFQGNKLAIKNASWLRNILAESNVKLKNFELAGSLYTVKCDLSALTNLQSLTFSHCANRVDLTVPQDNNITFFKADNCYNLQFDFLLFSRLKELALIKVRSNFYPFIDTAEERQLEDSKQDIDNLFKDYSLEKIEIENVTGYATGIEEYSPPQYLKLRKFKRLQTAILGKRFIATATLPEGCERKPREVKASSSSRPLLTFQGGPIEGWTTHGERKTELSAMEIDISRATYLESNFTREIKLNDVSTAIDLETLIINDTYDLSQLNVSHLSHLKKVKIKFNSDVIFTSAPMINLSGCSTLRELEIEINNGQPITVNLTGCHALHTLSLNTHQDSVELQGIEDCRNLRNVRIHATNALNYHQTFPEGCIRNLVNLDPRPGIPLSERILAFLPHLSLLQWGLLLAGGAMTSGIFYLGISWWYRTPSPVAPTPVPTPDIPGSSFSFSDLLNSVWGEITHVASSIWSVIEATPHFFYSTGSDVASIVWNTIQAIPHFVYSSVSGVSSFMWNTIQAIPHFAYSVISNMGSFIWDTIQAIPYFLYSGISNVAFNLWDIIQTISSAAYFGVSYIASAIWNGITAIPHLIYSVIVNMATGIWSGIQALPSIVMANPFLIVFPAMCLLAYILYKKLIIPALPGIQGYFAAVRPAPTSIPDTNPRRNIPTAPALETASLDTLITQNLNETKDNTLFTPAPLIKFRGNESPEMLERMKMKRSSYNHYYNLFETKTEKSELRSLKKDILESKETLTPLIELAVHQSPMQANKYLVRSLETEMQEGYSFENHLYIHSPEDLEEYFAPGKIENGEIKQETNGPLKKFMVDTGNPKVLVVNISNFTDQQRASFQSALDRPRPYLTLGSGDNTETIYLSDNIKVVCLIANDAPRGEAFQSRCKSWVLGSHICVETKQVSETKSFFSESKDNFFPLDINEGEFSGVEHKSFSLEIDLFNNPAWEEAILGEIIFEGQGAKLEKGPLFKAIALKQPLMIYNLPDDEKLRLFIHRVNDERKIILDNGQLVKIPDGVFIKIIDKPKNDLELKQIHIYSDQKQEEEVIKRRRIPLGIHNLHTCYKETILDEKNNAKTILGGLLDKYNPEEEVFYITTSIKESYWKKLLHEMKLRYPNKTFHFVLAPGASIENVAKRKILPIQLIKSEPESKRGLESKPSRTNNVYISNDPSYLAETLALENKGLVIAVHSKTTFGNLFTEIALKNGGGFSNIQTSILKDLQDGKTIVLNGELSLTLYYQLLPLLLDSPHIYSNKGERIDLPGRLICAMPVHMKEQLSSIQIEERLYEWNDYRQALAKDDYSDKLLIRIERFYHFADRIHPSRGDGRPEKAYKSYYRLARMLEALTQAEEKGTLHAHNPIKGIFLYDYPKDKGNYRDMVDYAYLNVMSKYIFCPNDETMARTDKLKKLKKIFNIQSDRDIESHAWHLLNCFSGKQLVAILGASLESVINFNGFPALTSTALANLKVFFKEHTNAESKEEKSRIIKLPRHEKQQDEFKALLNDKNVRLIILKGPPGAGKTYAVRQLFSRETTCYEGEDQFTEWLEKGGPFLWDEINMATDSELSVLEALRSSDRRFRYINKAKGIDKEYILDKHLVIGTCNSESLPGRRFFNILQDIGVTINVEEPSDEFLIEKILRPRLGENFQQFASVLIDAYHLIKQYNEFIPRSIRDIKGVTRRFLSLVNELKNPSKFHLKTALLQACEGEFAGSIKSPTRRKRFINELRTKLNLAIASEEKQGQCTLIQLTDDIFIPDTHQPFVNSIQQFLKMRLETLRARAREDKNDQPLDLQKQMLIVEGDPGLGKSTYLRAIVENHKQEMKKLIIKLKAERELLLIKQTAGVGSITAEILALDKDIAVIEAEIAKDVQEISVGSADASSLLVRVQEKEGIAIADEGNLDPDLAKTSNQLLCGVDEKRRPVDKRGFVYLRSQNSTAESGRPSGDPSDFNRADYMYIDTFTDHALKAFADRQNLPDSEQFVAAFREMSKKRSWINIRTFHVVLKELVQNLKEDKTDHSVPTSKFTQVDSGAGVGDLSLSRMWKIPPTIPLLEESKSHPLVHKTISG